MKHIIYRKSELQVIKEIIIRKIKAVLFFILDKITWPFRAIARKIASISASLYVRLFQNRAKWKKLFIYSIIAYCVFAAGINLGFYIYYKNANIDRIFYNIKLLIAIPIVIVSALLLKLSMWIYHFFIGERQLHEAACYATIEYVTKIMPKILKIFGRTGAGKDTLMAALMSLLSRDFKIRTIQDMELIKAICYIFDFEKLDLDLKDNYKSFLTSSKGKMRKAFLGTEDNPGMARIRNLYIKDYYLKKKISAISLINDLELFEENPITHDTKYAAGVGVSRKHFVQLVMYEYIEWWIRENIEVNYIMCNQPFIEDPDTGLMAKQFSFNFLRTRSISTKKKNPNTGKQEEVKENIFWPWKNRLVVGETECGSWYINLDDSLVAEMMSSGQRDFKAYQRHFMLDFYWFQVDQASDRTAKLFRELEHAYVAVLDRQEIEGGRVENIIPSIKLAYYKWRINRYEMKAYKYENKRYNAQTKINDYQELFWASSKDKYHYKFKKMKNKYRSKAMVDKYHEFKEKVSLLEREIETNKKNGYIIETLCISKSGLEPTDYTPESIHNIVGAEASKRKTTFVTQLTFKTSDCERYDTRYMRNLAEKRASNSKIEYAEVPTWPTNLKMTDHEIEFMAYNAAKAMFGISDKKYESIRYGNGYKDYYNKNE